MKVKGKKDLTSERARGRAAIDAILLPRISDAMGPKFTLYQAKAYAATIYGGQHLVNDDTECEEIVARFDRLLTSIGKIETERQALQALVDAAKSAAEIDAILATL